MFSGIVEEAAKVVAVRTDGGNIHITLKCSFADELKIDQSISHNGVCLTVVALPGDGTYTVTAIHETLERSNLADLKPGSLVNLERSMILNGRLDGHIVQGHVDCTAVCTGVEEADGSRYFAFSYNVPPQMAARGYVTVEKGSVTVNGGQSHRVRFRNRLVPCSNNSIHFRTYQFLPDRKRHTREPGIRHYRKYLAS